MSDPIAPEPFYGRRVTAAVRVPNGGSVDLVQPFGMSWKDPRSDVGAGETTLPYGDAQTAEAIPLRWVTLSTDNLVDGPVPRYSFVIEKAENGRVGTGEEATLGYKVSGRGHVCEWERMLLYPEDGVLRPPKSQTRYFNFASKYLDDSDWTPSIIPYLTPGIIESPWGPPKNFPDPFASFTWSRFWSKAGVDAVWDPSQSIGDYNTPVGTSYVRKRITLASPKDLVAFATADDLVDLWFDDKYLLSGEPKPGFSFPDTYEKVFSAAAGEHLISARLENVTRPFSGNIAGFLFTLFALSDISEHVGAPNALTHTGLVGTPGHLVNDGFLWRDLPGVPPGFNAGQIARIWHDEYVARGGIAWTLDWTDDLDSAGNPWAITSEFAFPIMTDGLAMLRSLADTHVDWYAVPDQRVLRMWNKAGRGTAVATTLQKGVNLTAATYVTSV